VKILNSATLPGMGWVSELAAGIAFGRFRLSPYRRELLADGQPIRLGGRAHGVLLALIEARGAVVSKEALMARVWAERIVEENVLQVQISALRAALRAEPGLIRTVSGRGYQFTGEIRLLAQNVRERPSGSAPVVVRPRQAPCWHCPQAICPSRSRS
jgi:DNA-binding winged helix-turn-helix (wHTH) protein